MAEVHSIGAHAPVITREIASALNPLIDERSVQTLCNVAEVLNDYGYLLSSKDAMAFERVYKITQVLSAALNYEASFLAANGSPTLETVVDDGE